MKWVQVPPPLGTAVALPTECLLSPLYWVGMKEWVKCHGVEPWLKGRSIG
ncbi:MAG: hypothetical protein ACP5P0_00530 [Hydrogenobacter sp.]